MTETATRTVSRDDRDVVNSQLPRSNSQNKPELFGSWELEFGR